MSAIDPERTFPLAANPEALNRITVNVGALLTLIGELVGGVITVQYGWGTTISSIITAMASRAAYLLAMPAILVLCACSTGSYKATNVPLPVDAPPGMTAAADIAGEHMIALSFSGGGMSNQRCKVG